MEIKYNPTFTLTDKESNVLTEAFNILIALEQDMRSHEILDIEGLTLRDVGMGTEVLRKAIEIGDN